MKKVKCVPVVRGTRKVRKGTETGIVPRSRPEQMYICAEFKALRCFRKKECTHARPHPLHGFCASTCLWSMYLDSKPPCVPMKAL